MRLGNEQLLESSRTIPRTYTKLGDIQIWVENSKNTSLEIPEGSHLSSTVKPALK